MLVDAHLEDVRPLLAHFRMLDPGQGADRGLDPVQLHREETTLRVRQDRGLQLGAIDLLEFALQAQGAQRPTLAADLTVPKGLPELDGPEARAQEVVALYNESRGQLRDVRGVALDKRGSWTISMRNGTEVVLGRNDPSARLARFAPLLPKLAAQHPRQKLVRADLRYTNGFSLTWADLPKTAPAKPLPKPLATLLDAAGTFFVSPNRNHGITT